MKDDREGHNDDRKESDNDDFGKETRFFVEFYFPLKYFFSHIFLVLCLAYSSRLGVHP